MTKRATLRDIAKQAGVSAVTVHKVLYAKRGVSEETRKNVLDIARRMDYSLNEAASSLKRRALHIAVILQNIEDPENQNFFFRKMWKGIDRAEADLRDYGVRITRLECGNDWQSQAEILRAVERRRDVDGIILHCWDETKLNGAIDALADKGVPSVTVNSDAIGSKRVGCVSAQNDRLGMLAAEILGRFVPARTHVLLAGGNRMVENLRASREGFHAYLKKSSPDTRVTEVYNTGDKDAFCRDLAGALETHGDVAGIHSITSRDTYNTCAVVRRLGLTDRVKVVGSDAFVELIDFFGDDTLHATVWKDEMAQAERAVRLLYQYLSERPMYVEPIRIGIVMNNNLRDYL